MYLYGRGEDCDDDDDENDDDLAIARLVALITMTMISLRPSMSYTTWIPPR